MSLEQLFGRPSQAGRDDGSHWLSVSDLMAGLMMIFLFIAISYMRHVQEQREKIELERDQIKQVAVAWNDTVDAIYAALKSEFSADLPRWNAELDRETLTFRFKEPDVLFDRNRSDIKPEFQQILDDFFPRYLATLDYFQTSIDEIRIEGHTSSEWNTTNSTTGAYFENMRLSQERTRSVLEYCYLLPASRQYSWLKSVLAAVGLSSSRLIMAKGKEDRERSRRVEFKVKTNVEMRMVEIIERAS